MHIFQQSKSLFLVAVLLVASLGATEHAQSAVNAAAAAPVIQLSEEKIAQLKKEYASDFIKRSYLAKSIYAVSGGSILWFSYKWGVFDLFLPDHLCATNLATLPEVTDPSKSMEYLATLVAYMKSESASVHDRLAALEKHHKDNTGHWIMNALKYVGWTGVSLVGGIVVQSKWRSFFEYALAQPSFEWFLSHHSVLSTINGVKRSIKKLTEIQLNPDYSNEYHARAIQPALESIAQNMHELIAFTEYYLEKCDQTMVYDLAMDSVPRYLFNETNDFFKKIYDVLQDPAQHPSAPLIVDEFHNDLSVCINRCTRFEKPFID